MIYLGADHAGFALKEEIKKYLLGLGMEVEDLGAFELNPDDDYPDFIVPVAKKVALRLAPSEVEGLAQVFDSESQTRGGENQTFGLVFGGSGQGEAIVANKVKGIRAAVYYGGSLDIVKLSRQHNNANILSLGARFLTADQAKEAIRVWLETPFEGGRHQRRIEKIEP